MSTTTSSSTSVMIPLKRAVRKAQLRYLRQWTRAHPLEAEAESEGVSAVLFDYVMEQYHRAPPPGHATSGPLFLCVYLPLSYETDLRPLMRRLWAWKAEQRAPANGNPPVRDLCVMVPVVLDPDAALRAGLMLPSCRSRPQTTDAASHTPSASVPLSTPQAKPSAVPSSSSSDKVPLPIVCACPDATREDPPQCEDYNPNEFDHAMVFVEVHDDADLRASFAESGKFKILELQRPIFHRLFHRHTLANTGEPRAPADVSTRRVLPCDRWGTLFPMFQRPPGLIRWAKEVEDDTVNPDNAAAGVTTLPHRVDTTLDPQLGSQLIVLAPGVRFDVTTGARLGKGGGFYDRFLAFQRAQRLRCVGDGCWSDRLEEAVPHDAEDARPSDAFRVRTASLQVVGVGFRCQFTPGDGSRNDLFQNPENIVGEVDVARLPVPYDPESDVGVDVVVTPDGYAITSSP